MARRLLTAIWHRLKGGAPSEPQQNLVGSLVADLHHFSLHTPAALALHCEGADYDYGQVAHYAACVAAKLDQLGVASGARVGVLGSRGFPAYGAVLGTLWHGSTYVPFDSNLPAARLAELLERAEISALLVDSGIDGSRLAWAAAFRGPVYRLGITPPEISVTTRPPRDAEGAAYLIFTSGSTGQPKGCAPRTRQVSRFIDAMCAQYPFTAQDRFGQYCELGFDASVFILFTAMRVGGSVHVIPEHQRMTPLPFLRRQGVTVCYLIPSLVTLQYRTHQLRDDYMPQMRLLFFGAETLTVGTARRWLRGAPNCQVINFYGPTEVTVSCSAFPFQPSADMDESAPVPIGAPLPGLEMAVLDAQLRPLPAGEKGEIVVSGEQVLSGYWRDNLQSGRAFVGLADDDKRWYRTGDYGFCDLDGNFHLCGRVDDQIQLRGRRIEPAEIRRHLLNVTGADEAVLIPGPEVEGNVFELTAFVQADVLDQSATREALRACLPAYAMPTALVAVREWPRTPSGKIDRAALIEHAAGGNSP